MEQNHVLLTGGSGFIGRNVRSELAAGCTLFVPTRQELDLLDETAVRRYLTAHSIRTVIHAANPNPVKNPLDAQERMLEDSLRVFMNLYQAQALYERMYTLGSGAEYDKSREISLIPETQEGRAVPYDAYGLSKFIMDKLIAGSEKQCNLRIFACFGDGDHASKFITHCIRCCLRGEDITIRQDCLFDYMHVSDLAKILVFFASHTPQYRAYNVCTGTRVLLSTIAQTVREEMHAENCIRILSPGRNHEYTGDNTRLLREMGGYSFLPLREGIRRQIRSELYALERNG